MISTTEKISLGFSLLCSLVSASAIFTRFYTGEAKSRAQKEDRVDGKTKIRCLHGLQGFYRIKISMADRSAHIFVFMYRSCSISSVVNSLASVKKINKLRVQYMRERYMEMKRYNFSLPVSLKDI